jgi:hypothetical protein
VVALLLHKKVNGVAFPLAVRSMAPSADSRGGIPVLTVAFLMPVMLIMAYISVAEKSAAQRVAHNMMFFMFLFFT